jgi:hypothetical protein
MKLMSFMPSSFGDTAPLDRTGGQRRKVIFGKFTRIGDKF